ncbi:MAG: hypothetical protein KJ749_08835, partial [Planctomycetes bacterium]|nr:hypothetical protein [Planctomycetota bacterium]
RRHRIRHQPQRVSADRGSYEGIKLENTILPMFYDNRTGYTDVMRHAIAINGSFFNTRRMMQNYVAKAYFE